MAVFFQDHEHVAQRSRTLSYEAAMERLAAKYPDDDEAQIFYALAINEAVDLSDSNYSPSHRCEKLSQIRHVPERRIQRRSMGVRPQVSNVPEETIQTSSRLATRLTSHRQLLSTWRW